MTPAVTGLSCPGSATKSRRYLLLPPAGASLTALRHIVDAAPGVAVWGVEYPGRGTRIADPLPATLADLAEQIAGELTPASVGELVLVGFSMGAFVALEVVRRVHARSGVAPSALVVVGAVAPQRRVPGRYAPTGSDTLIRLLDRDGLVPGFGDSPEAWDYALELLRGDLRLANGYRRTAVERVPCAVAAFCGADDPSLDSVDDATDAWRSWTAGPFTSRVVPGGHLGLLAPGRAEEFWSRVRELDKTITAVAACDG